MDVNLTGKAVTADDGKINLTISYEDENGNITEETRDFILNVNEEAETDFDITDQQIPEEENRGFNPLPVIIGGGLSSVIIAGALILKKRKSKKEQM